MLDGENHLNTCLKLFPARSGKVPAEIAQGLGGSSQSFSDDVLYAFAVYRRKDGFDLQIFFTSGCLITHERHMERSWNALPDFALASDILVMFTKLIRRYYLINPRRGSEYARAYRDPLDNEKGPDHE